MCLAQTTPKVTLETSETLFTILASMNACGYDQDLNVSDPVRKQIRGEVNRAAHDSDDALEAIAESALERKIGARGLRMIIEDLMLDLMYQVPTQKKVREVTITREVVLAKDKPITLIEKAG